MKFKKILGVAVSVLTLTAVCVTGNLSSIVSEMTAKALDYSIETEYGDYLMYVKVDEDEDGNCDYIEISYCDDSAVSVEIPSEIEGLPVRTIGYGAFSLCEKLEAVTIPDSIAELTSWAFYGCASLKSVEIPNGVKEIGDEVFCDCTSLESVIIPDSVTEIGSCAFEGTPWLEGKQAENPLVIINDILIDGTTCKGNVVVPDGVKKIGDNAFYFCEDIKSIKIPDSVTSIGEGAFCFCMRLAAITIPDSVTEVGYLAFEGTPWLEEKQAEDQLLIINNILCYAGDCEGDVVIPDGVSRIDDMAFCDCENLESIKIPDSVISIGYGAFMNCISLEDITIPESVAKIGESAFESCTSLESITIENPVCEIFDSGATICNDFEIDEDDDFELICYFNGTVYGCPDSTAQAYAKKYGYSFKSIDEKPVTIQGDISGNGSIDLKDAIIIAKYILGTVNLSEGEKKIADFNDDGKVDLYDVIDIAKCLLEGVSPVKTS